MEYDIFSLEQELKLEPLEGIIRAICLGGEFMTKTKYEERLHELEEKEGKCFTIKEISEITHLPIDTIKVYISLQSVKTFKILHYKTQQNITFVPQNEVLKLMLKRTSILHLLKGLTMFKIDTCNSIDDWINLFNEINLEE